MSKLWNFQHLKIIMEFPTFSGEFPWTVAILKEEKALDGQILNVYVCGGSLIDAGKDNIFDSHQFNRLFRVLHKIIFPKKLHRCCIDSSSLC